MLLFRPPVYLLFQTGNFKNTVFININIFESLFTPTGIYQYILFLNSKNLETPTYFAFPFIWRSRLHKKIIWVSECIQFIEKIFFLIFNLIELFLYGNLYCGLLFRPHVCLLFLIGNLGREQNLLKPGPGTQATGR